MLIKMLIKSLPNQSPLKTILSAALLLALFAAAPAISRANEPSSWQMLIDMPDAPSQTISLVSDYTCNGVPCTLDAPMIPLRAFANALGISPEFCCMGGVAMLLWPAENACVLLNGLPHIISLTPDATCQPLYEVPLMIEGSYCAPISLLDIWELDYDIDAANMLITVRPANAAAASPARVPANKLWQAASPQLDILLTPTRHLLSSVTQTIDATVDANSLLYAAGKLHGTCVPPGGSLAGGTGHTLLDATLCTALKAAGLPPTNGIFTNHSVFPIQLTCHVAPGDLTVQVYQLNSLSASGSYAGQIAP